MYALRKREKLEIERRSERKKMAVDLRQVMGGILTFSMFIMLGNMVKKDHIDPFLVSFFLKFIIIYSTQ